MATTERISEEAYRRLALADPGGRWELHEGLLREKPGMSVEHGGVMAELAYMLRGQLGRNEYRVRAHHARLRSPETYYVPDVVVIPAALERALRQHPCSLDAYAAPLPLVAESGRPPSAHTSSTRSCPSTKSDQARGDLEIWHIHPYERTLSAWRRQSDGGYVETAYRDGIVRRPRSPASRLTSPRSSPTDAATGSPVYSAHHRRSTATARSRA